MPAVSSFGPWELSDASGWVEDSHGRRVAGLIDSEAHGRLIAAAPDLLAALLPLLEFAQEANRDPHMGDCLADEIRAACAAIAKAEGRAPGSR